MNYKKYLLEVGSGIDLHGEDVTKAARKAIRDAITHASMIGLRQLFHIKSFEELHEALMVDVTIATPYPEKINREEVLKELPEGQRKLTVVEGGMRFPTTANKAFNDIRGVVVVNAMLVVLIDIDKIEKFQVGNSIQKEQS